MNIYARQGDLVFNQLPISGDLTKVSGLILAGTDTAAHTIKGSVMTRQDGDVTMLRVTKKVKVEHAGRHQPITLVPGDYQVHVLRERGDGFDRRVED